MRGCTFLREFYRAKGKAFVNVKGDKMDGKIKIELGKVQKTLLIPLFGRALEYEKEHPLVRDKYAHEIVEKLDYDFNVGFDKVPLHFMINSAIRAHHLDAAIAKVIAEFPDATIVSIGAGLDTTFQRLDNGRMFWYDLDLPDSIDLRRKLIPEGPRNKCIAKSVFDRTWFSDVKERRSKVLFISGGVLVYLKEEEVRRLFLNMIQEFPGSEIVFEVYSKKMLWLRNNILARRQAKMELFSPMQWGVNSAKDIATWSDKIRVLDEFPFYSRINLAEYWDKKTLTPLKIMNFFKVMKMVRLKLG
jgi:O-methyltransferase involved in polyketide biosynthesis